MRAPCRLGLGALVEEIAYEGREELWALEARRVPGPLDDGQAGVFTDGCDRASRDGRELVVAGPHDHEHGHLELAEALPKRRLGSCAGGPERGGQARSAVGEARSPVRLIVAEVGKKWPGEPSVDESRYPVVPAGFDLGCRQIVGVAAGEPVRLVVDARVSPDDDETLDELRRGEGKVETAPPPSE